MEKRTYINMSRFWTMPLLITIITSVTFCPWMLMTFASSHEDTQGAMVQFPFREVTASEMQKVVDVPIERTGNVDHYFSVRCTTEPQTAQPGQDYVERPDSNQSSIVFVPGERMKSCGILLLDDTAHEVIETFLVHLSPTAGSNQGTVPNIGRNSTVLVRIVNDEDIPTVQFHQSAYSMQEPSAIDHVASTVIGVMRLGDENGTSRVRVFTRDGSGTAGLDYHPKNKVLTFSPGEQVQFMDIEVLHNSEYHWHRTFTVNIASNDLVNAKLGTVAVATVKVLEYGTWGSAVLPTLPVVVSLRFYDNVAAGLGAGSSPSYPVACVTPCDSRFPSYATTQRLCHEAAINASSMRFAWEVAPRLSFGTSNQSSGIVFRQLVDATLFALIDRMVLDSTHFREGFLVRCVAQPVTVDGRIGVPVRSLPICINSNASLCLTSAPLGIPIAFQSQSFVATLRYLGVKDATHPNRIHIRVEVPHQDGMLPLISTHPLHNLQLLLSDPIYRRQHACSNLVLPNERDGLLGDGFLKSTDNPSLTGASHDDFPYQYDTELRGNNTVTLYRHLNLNKCLWVFDAWYHMAELVELCGGYVVSHSQVNVVSNGQTTVRVPLYVTYVFASSHQGWTSMEHHTEMEFSFKYNTILWHAGIGTDSGVTAKVLVQRIVIGNSGQIVIDLQTKANFRGLFVMRHPNLPDQQSRIVPPPNLILSFNLTLLWTAETYDGPLQTWKAISIYSYKDYTGKYVLELVPCTVAQDQKYIKTSVSEVPPCTPHLPQRYDIPIAFQQTNRPVPIVYSLDTDFQLTNDEHVFLSHPNKSFHDVADEGTFSRGQNVFGRVLWHPDQDLQSVYKLRIEQVYICSGQDGYTPLYDPNGSEYGEGPHFGCLHPSRKLKHRLIILDRGKSHDLENSLYLPVKARFAEDVPKYSVVLQDMTGVDGFVFPVDELYNIDAMGLQWYIQVVYTIGPLNSALRTKREAQQSLLKDGTNLRYLWLTASTSSTDTAQAAPWPLLPLALTLALFSIVALSVLLVRNLLRHHRFTEIGCRAACFGTKDHDVVVLFGDDRKCTVKVQVLMANNSRGRSPALDDQDGTEV